MALSQKKTNERKAHMMVVKRAYKFDNNNISFDLEIDGWITIYNMLLVATYSEKDKSKKDKSKCIPEAYFELLILHFTEEFFCPPGGSAAKNLPAM